MTWLPAAFPAISPEAAWHYPALAAIELLARRAEAMRRQQAQSPAETGPRQTMEGLRQLAQRPMYPGMM